MIERFTRGRQPIVCVDFGHDRLSVLEVAEGSVTRWITRPLPEDALRNGDPILPGYVGEAVRQSMARADMHAQRVRIALPDEATVSRQVTLPAMPARDLVKAMHFVAEQHIPFPIARARWAWDVVQRDRSSITIYLVATWRDLVDRYGELARAAGLEPEVLEPRALAVARALDQDQALVLDAGTSRLHVTLLVGGQPTFVDEAEVGAEVPDEREALDRLLQRAYRHQSQVAGTPGRLAPVLLAGELEDADLELPMPGRPVSEVLNGQLPLAPHGFRPGGYLANLGLSMRGAR
ncbi:MAG TPA: type II secretion system protein GspL [Candidatus Dormibacteraeota bacterium]|nr:type II secretion system protein GspL [Candidatus Dormibacteraeota bacterium]